MNYKVSITGIDTSKLPVLTHKEMTVLFERMKNGDMLAKEDLVMGNIKLVLSILKRFNNGKYNMDDLFQVGMIGLIKAIDNFDMSYNLRLSTYAVPLILGEIKRHIRDDMTIRVSRGTKDLAYQIIKFQEDFLKEHGDYPGFDIIGAHFNISEYKVRDVLDSLKEPISIYKPIYDDGGDTIYLEDQIADKIEDKDSLIGLKKALTYIKKRDRNILLSRYLYGKTQNEIADMYGISQAQVSRIEACAIKQLKKVLK